MAEPPTPLAGPIDAEYPRAGYGANALEVAKYDLLTNTWHVDAYIDEHKGLEGQAAYWREYLEDGHEEYLEAFDAFVAERIAPYYPGPVL